MIKKILTYIFYILILGFIVFTLGGRLFGIKYYVVISDSMYPAIPKNSIVYVKPIDEDEMLKLNDIIAIDMGRTPLMHRIIDIKNGKIITHGDNNQEGVNEEVSRNKVIGKVFFSIPVIGILFRSIYPLLILSLLVLGLIIGDKLLKELKKGD